MRRGSILAAACLLAGCAGLRQPSQPERAPPPTAAAADKAYQPDPVDQDKLGQLRTDVIRGLLNKGLYYAALAHIEEQKRSGDNPELTYLEAEARRHLDQREQAEALYRKLVGSPFEGLAYHGIGLLLAPTNTEAAIRNLRSASERLPTDVDIRNDYGYALMESGRYEEAMTELSTAAELSTTPQPRVLNNLLIWMLLTENPDGLQRLMQSFDKNSKPDLDKLREQAKSIQAKQLARLACRRAKTC